VVRQTALQTSERSRMLALMELCYDGIEAEQFFADLDTKDAVILLYSRAQDHLVGFSTIRVVSERVYRRRVDLIFSGDTVIHPDYWGQKALHIAFGRFLLRRKLRHPFRPCLWLLLSKGFKTYLLMANHFPRSFPRLDKEMPAAYVALRDRMARAWWQEAYDPSPGIVHLPQPRDRVKAAFAVIDSATRALPHVAFFVSQNPGYAYGDELVCLAELRVVDVVRAMIRLVWRKGWHTVRRVLHRPVNV
jgi:hypothetical protein